LRDVLICLRLLLGNCFARIPWQRPEERLEMLRAMHRAVLMICRYRAKERGG
jgi:hypothetical protein